MSDDEPEPEPPVGPGDRIAGDRFELLDRLGDGGSAVVDRAHDLVADEIVAVKIGRLAADRDSQLRDQYFIPRADEASFPVLAFELVEGATLAREQRFASRRRRGRQHHGAP